LRLLGEKITEVIFERHQISFPNQNTFHNRLKTLELEDILPDQVKDLFYLIKNKGNFAVHNNKGTIEDVQSVLFACFKVCKWFYETYSKVPKDISDLRYSIPENLDTRHALSLLEKDYKVLETKFTELIAERHIGNLKEEEIKSIQSRSYKAANKIDMSEAETRDLIDEQLRQAGWEVNTHELNYKSKKTVPVRGKNIAIAEWPANGKWADYALFIGLDLVGIVEAKKYSQDISTDLRQSKIYSELIEPLDKIKFLGEWGKYKVPFLFSTNGRPFLKQIETKSGIWFLDVRNERNISRSLHGWYSPDGLKKLFEQNLDNANKKLAAKDIDFLTSPSGLSLREYQIKAIRSVEDQLINNPSGKRALLAMATGTGKTRTIIGLCYRLIQANRFKRILFLVDRTLLGIQAINAFKDNKVIDLNTFADVYNVKGLKEALPDIDTRLQFATVQGMVKRILYSEDDVKKPSVDTYDCIIIDEAHRGYLLDKELGEDDLDFKDQRDYVSKYRMVIDYFDSYAVGLTATPALHTTEIFGKPIYSYSYREAVIDGFLIDHDPPFIIKTKLSDEGIVWAKGEKPKAYDKESNKIIELAELADELSIDIAGFNKLVLTESFNRTVVKELTKHLDPEGEEKTLVFAATDEHADKIVQYFKEEYRAIGVEVPDDAIQKITGKSYDPVEQVKRFKNESFPTIVVTVDLLTTGVDIPTICNLVFLRRVKSRILYEQMLGRATRLCDEIGKESFKIFDAVRVYETLEDYTEMKPVAPNQKTSFTQLIGEFDQIGNNERAKKQLEQIIAKLQRKKKKIHGGLEDKFKYHTKGNDPESFINMLKGIKSGEDIKSIIKLTGLWKFLDEMKPDPVIQFWSEHKDEFYGIERGYGKGQKPQDYLDGFKKFILENQNKIMALNIICTKPKELDRRSLKELLLVLDDAGYNTRFLHAAWKDAKNEDIAADIISYIRTLTLGNALISHEERISRAVQKIREMRTWNKTQLNWLDRFEKQLLAETVLKIEDLNASPFKDKGGFKQLNKIFENQLQDVLDKINENLYREIA
jgi:type I restriction enzyme R subunit